MSQNCYVCGGNDFSFHEVLWPDLIQDWQLSPAEAEYINFQQGYSCNACGNNIRSIALAKAILSNYPEPGTLVQFVTSDAAKQLSVLEINEAGGLTPILQKLPNHILIRFPEYDMTRLSYAPGMFDLVIHSDTLEHVPDPVAGLAECRRVMSVTGRCLFTVPAIIGRLTRFRKGMKMSYHGCAGKEADDFLVHTEFGADVWKFALEAGFSKVTLHCLQYPSGLAIEAGL
jgi:SAM-dependent methyltransferase